MSDSFADQVEKERQAVRQQETQAQAPQEPRGKVLSDYAMAITKEIIQTVGSGEGMVVADLIKGSVTYFATRDLIRREITELAKLSKGVA